MRRHTRFSTLGLSAALVLAVAACSSTAASNETAADGSNGATETANTEPVRFGVLLPETGDSAEYGRQFKLGFELALNEINEAGGIDGRPVELIYEDTQADPAQAATVAQKFVDDTTIVAAIGDFGTPASAAASPILQDAGLLHFAFSASASTVTDPGDYVFATWVSQEYEAPRLADLAATKGEDVAVFYHDTDWGQDTYDFYHGRSDELGLNEAYTSAYNPESTDFRPQLLQAQKSGADVIALISYDKDGALITSQAREVGIDLPIVGLAPNYSLEFLELAGEASEGFETLSYFSPLNPADHVQDFLELYEAEYDEVHPNDYAIRAYDALNVVIWAVAHSENPDDREAVRDALRDGTDIPTVLYGPITFDENRRLTDAEQYLLKVENGEWVLVE